MPISFKIILSFLGFWLLLLILAGCTTPSVKLVHREPLGLTEPAPVTLRDVEVTVITRDNATEQLNAVEQAGNPPVLFGLTEEDLKNMSKNMEILRGKLDEYKELLIQYRKYYEPVTQE